MAFRHDLFLGLQPEEPAREVIGLHQACRRAASRSGVGLVPLDCLHMTLHPIGSSRTLPRPIVDRAIAAAETVRMPPFVIALNRITPWNGSEGRTTLVLTGDEGVIGADLLQADIVRALGRAWLLPGRYGFNPHVTLMRGRSIQPDAIIETIHWPVNEFVLIHSLVGESRHEVLGRWPLRTVH